jgi:hypothetical protein
METIMIELTIKSRMEEKTPNLIDVDKITRGAIWAIYNMLQKRSGVWWTKEQPIAISEKIDGYETEVSVRFLSKKADCGREQASIIAGPQVCPKPPQSTKKIKLRAIYALSTKAQMAMALNEQNVSLEQTVEFEADAETAISEGVALVTKEGEIKQNMALLAELLSREASTDHNWASGCVIWKRTDPLDKILTSEEATARYSLTIDARRIMREKTKARKKFLRERLDVFIRRILGGEGEIPTPDALFFIDGSIGNIAFDNEVRELMTTDEEGLLVEEARRRNAIAEDEEQIKNAQHRIIDRENERELEICNFEKKVYGRKEKEAAESA